MKELPKSHEGGEAVLGWAHELKLQFSQDDEKFRILISKDDESVVFFENNGVNWLVVEEARYRPMREEQYSNHPAFYDFHQRQANGMLADFPFMTTGTRWYVNLDELECTIKDFEEDEGSIQGVTYALQNCDEQRLKDYMAGLICALELDGADSVPIDQNIFEEIQDRI